MGAKPRRPKWAKNGPCGAWSCTACEVTQLYHYYDKGGGAATLCGSCTPKKDKEGLDGS